MEKLTSYWQSLPWKGSFFNFMFKLKSNSSKYLPKLVLITVSLLLIQTVANLTWSLFDNKESQTMPVNKAAGSALASITKQANLNQVAQYHLFGNAKTQAAPQQTKVINAPDTRLHLILKGVFAASNPKMAIAIIATKKGEEKSYHIGDKLNGGALLHAVYADRVILKRNGNLETLRLPKAATKNLYNKSAEPLSVSRNAASAVNRSNKQKLKNLRKTLLTDPGKIWKQVRINPVMKKGKISGYSIVHYDTALMNSLGLRKTDVIVAVNGESLSDPATLYGLISTLSKQTSLAVTIERNGKQQDIQVTF